MTPSRILVLNGPNLNLLGSRQPDLYGSVTLAKIEEWLAALASELKLTVDCRQSNHEGQLVDWIQQAPVDNIRGIILNAAAYTHTSLAIADAVAAISLPVIEVHLSNIYARESIRQHSLLAPVVKGQITGLGYRVYLLALRALAEILDGQ